MYSGRLAVHCLRPLQACEEDRGHCGDQRMLSGDINTKCMMGEGTVRDDRTMTEPGR